MKKTDTFTEIAGLEKDLADIAPLVRKGFSQAAPSAGIEEAIRAEARRVAAQRQRRHAWPLYRTLTAAAALMLLVGGGALQVRLSCQANTRKAATADRLAAEAAKNVESANLLLEIQGLSEEGFFRHEETESL